MQQKSIICNSKISLVISNAILHPWPWGCFSLYCHGIFILTICVILPIMHLQNCTVTEEWSLIFWRSLEICFVFFLFMHQHARMVKRNSYPFPPSGGHQGGGSRISKKGLGEGSRVNLSMYGNAGGICQNIVKYGLYSKNFRKGQGCEIPTSPLPRSFPATKTHLSSSLNLCTHFPSQIENNKKC